MIKQLKEQLLQANNQIKSLTVENQKLDQKLQRVIKAYESVDHQANQLSEQLKLKDIQISEINKQKLRHSPNKDSLDQSGQLSLYQNYQVYAKDKEIKQLKDTIETRNKEVAHLKALHSQQQIAGSFGNQVVLKLQSDMELLSTAKQNLIREVDRLLLEKGAEGCFRMELDHLRAENAILNALLGNSAKDKVDKEEHQTDQVELKTLKRSQSMKPANLVKDYCSNCPRDIYYYRQCCNPLSQIDEKLLFVPSGAYNFAQAFKLKYINDKNDLKVDEVLELLLFELNKHWCLREQTNLQRIKKRCQEQMNALKRHNDSLNYDEKAVLMQLKRLKQEVKPLHHENAMEYQQKWIPKTIQL